MRHSHAHLSGSLTKSRPVLVMWLAAFALLMSLIAVGPGAPRAARAADTIMPLSDITADMTGYAKTVIKGHDIATFDVTVVGILDDMLYTGGSLVMLETGGPVIEQTGGIAAGMSGSPVYIDGKLAAAVSYGYNYADHTLCLATPAESMMNILNYGRAKGARSAMGDEFRLREGSVVIGGRKVDTVKLAATADEAKRIESSAAGTTVAFRCLGPLFTLSGAEPGSKAFERIEEHLAKQGMPLVSGSHTRGTDDITIEPGAALGAAIITGDINLAAIGTTTYTDEDTVLAFGHPFFWAGAIEYPMVNAEILGVWPSIAAPFKVSNVGKVVGAINQDRRNGIAGTLDAVPDTVPETVTATNVDDETSAVTKANIARFDLDPDSPFGGWYWYQPILIGSERVWDADVGGTAEVSFTVRATDVLSGTPVSITRWNRNSDAFSMSGYRSLSEIVGVVQGLWSVKDGMRIDGIDYQTTLSESITSCYVDDVDIAGGAVAAGRSVRVRARVIPYGETARTIDVTLTVPWSAEAPFSVGVTSGGSYYGWGNADAGDPEDVEPLQALKEHWEGKPTNDRLYFSVRGSGASGDGLYGYGGGGYGSYYGYYGGGGGSYAEDTRTTVTTYVSTGYAMESSVSKLPSVISMRVAPRPVRAGSRLSFGGSIKAAGMPNYPFIQDGEWVRIYRKLPSESGYRKVASTKTDFYGRYAATMNPTQTASYYAEWRGNRRFMADWTGALAAGVRSKVTLSGSPASVTLGQKIHLSGSVSPNHSGLTVSLQRMVAGRWRTFATATLAADSTYAYDWKPSRRGLYPVRAYFPADADNWAGWSSTRYFRAR